MDETLPFKVGSGCGMSDGRCGGSLAGVAVASPISDLKPLPRGDILARCTMISIRCIIIKETGILYLANTSNNIETTKPAA